LKFQIKDCSILVPYTNTIRTSNLQQSLKMTEPQGKYPSSVKQFTQQQLASAFVKITKDPRVARVVVPDPQSLSNDVRRMATWKIDPKYATVQGVGDLNRAIVKIMVFSKTIQARPPTSQASVDNSALIAGVEKQIAELNLKLSQNPSEKAKIESDIAVKNTILAKLRATATATTVEEKEEFSQVQMASIAKRVFEIMTDQNKNFLFHQELDFIVRPKVDHIKESTGGDYVLQNTSKDRRFKSEAGSWMAERDRDRGKPREGEPKMRSDTVGNWRERSDSNTPSRDSTRDTSRESTSAPFSAPVKSRYVPPTMRQGDRGNEKTDLRLSENRFSALATPSGSAGASTSQPSRSVYVPPALRRNQDSDAPDQKTQRRDSNELSQSKPVEQVDRYKPPHERLTGYRYGAGDARRPDERPGGRFSRDDRPRDDRYRGDRGDRSDRGDRGNRYDRGDGSDRNTKVEGEDFLDLDKISTQVDVSSIADFPSLPSQSNEKAKPQKAWGQRETTEKVEKPVIEKPVSVSQLISTSSLKKIETVEDDDDFLDGWLDISSAKSHDTKSSTTGETSSVDTVGAKQASSGAPKQKSFADIAKEAKDVKFTVAPKPAKKGNAPKASDEPSWEDMADDTKGDAIPVVQKPLPAKTLATKIVPMPPTSVKKGLIVIGSKSLTKPTKPVSKPAQKSLGAFDDYDEEYENAFSEAPVSTAHAYRGPSVLSANVSYSGGVFGSHISSDAYDDDYDAWGMEDDY
ncbi:hypothetical protein YASMINEVIRUS_1209, partial [Yasminevirus sp. GU-2018]